MTKFSYHYGAPDEQSIDQHLCNRKQKADN
jgi:hypothetical protein